MQNDFQILKDLVIQQVFKLTIVALLSDAIFCFLPELVGDIVICEALTVEHYHLKEIFHSKSQVACFDLKVALSFRVPRMPRDLDNVLIISMFNSLNHLHFVLSKRVAVLSYQNLVVESPNSQLHPLN